MPVKTILTYVDRAPGDEAQLAVAIAAARRFDAHLSVAAVAYLPEIVVDPFPGIAAPTQEARERARAAEEARDLARVTSDKLAAEDIRGDAAALVTSSSQLSRDFGEWALFADLVVLQRFGAGDEGPERAAFEGALFHGEAAVLLCPDLSALRPARVMIAWDGSTTALRAVRRARPFLQEAGEIEIVMVNASDWQAKSAEQLALMLSRYGQTVSIFQATSSEETEAEALVQRQITSGAELTVLGGYGHSRLREMVLGGVTRELPGISKTPLLMVH